MFSAPLFMFVLRVLMLFLCCSHVVYLTFYYVVSFVCCLCFLFLQCCSHFMYDDVWWMMMYDDGWCMNLRWLRMYDDGWCMIMYEPMHESILMTDDVWWWVMMDDVWCMMIDDYADYDGMIMHNTVLLIMIVRLRITILLMMQIML